LLKYIKGKLFKINYSDEKYLKKQSTCLCKPHIRTETEILFDLNLNIPLKILAKF